MIPSFPPRAYATFVRQRIASGRSPRRALLGIIRLEIWAWRRGLM